MFIYNKNALFFHIPCVSNFSMLGIFSVPCNLSKCTQRFAEMFYGLRRLYKSSGVVRQWNEGVGGGGTTQLTSFRAFVSAHSLLLIVDPALGGDWAGLAVYCSLKIQPVVTAYEFSPRFPVVPSPTRQTFTAPSAVHLQQVLAAPGTEDLWEGVCTKQLHTVVDEL